MIGVDLGRRAIALALGVCAGLRIFLQADDMLAMGTGTLTEPMATAAWYGSIVLLFGAFIQFWRRKSGLIFSIAGFGLTLPFFSWQFFPGRWCSFMGACASVQPLFRFDSGDAVSIGMAVLSIGLQAFSKSVQVPGTARFIPDEPPG